MDRQFDPSTQQHIRSFQRRLDAMADFYAYALTILSAARVKADMEALHARKNRRRWPFSVRRLFGDRAEETDVEQPAVIIIDVTPLDDDPAERHEGATCSNTSLPSSC